MREAAFLAVGYIAGFVMGGLVVYGVLFRRHR